MSDKLLIIGGGILAYMLLQKQQQTAYVNKAGIVNTGGVRSMPASVGSGLQQVATGAVAGFLQSIIKAPANNTSSNAFVPYGYDPFAGVRGDPALGEAVMPETVWY